jgi:hypothetical protein
VNEFRFDRTRGGGILLDIVSPVLNMLNFWFGDIKIKRYADDCRGKVEPNCHIEVETLSSVTGTVELSWNRITTKHGEDIQHAWPKNISGNVSAPASSAMSPEMTFASEQGGTQESTSPPILANHLVHQRSGSARACSSPGGGWF